MYPTFPTSHHHDEQYPRLKKKKYYIIHLKRFWSSFIVLLVLQIWYDQFETLSDMCQ